jgi:glutathione S-transferase
VQRVWVAFELLGVPYQYYEVDPYEKPKDLLELSPKGLVPALKLNEFNPPRSLNESTVILEYLNDFGFALNGRTILPPISLPYPRALIRLQADHVNRSLVPSFYRYLQAQDSENQIKYGKEFISSIEILVKLLQRAEQELLESEDGGPEEDAIRKALGAWLPGGNDLGWVDIMAGPWLYRAKIVLVHYRGFQMPQGERFNAWLQRLFEHPAFKATCSTDEFYIDSYERYAFNRPNTSQVATAINEGRALP